MRSADGWNVRMTRRAGFDVRAEDGKRIGVARAGESVESVCGVRHDQIMYRRQAFASTAST